MRSNEHDNDIRDSDTSGAPVRHWRSLCKISRRFLGFSADTVQVESPFQAILDYERAHNIPIGWVNFSISRAAPNGSWQQLERGEIKLDKEFFSRFHDDLHRADLWVVFHERRGSRTSPPPPLPQIDTEALFWDMMRISREPDRYMFPALKKLKASGRFLMGALSNTVIFPPGHPYNEDKIQLHSQFDFFVSSAHVGLRKPDPKIYELALSRANEVSSSRGGPQLKPGDVLFLDDIGQNLKAASQVGFRTLKVVLGKTKEAVQELERITGVQLLENTEQPKL